MFPKQFAAGLLVVASALATSDAFAKVEARSLVDRQSQSFTPDTTFGNGATCSAAFGAGYLSCGPGNACFNPSIGDSCCQNSYACPAGSFCLVNNLCCPVGLDPKTCAAQNGVTLPPGFATTAATSAQNGTTIPPTSKPASALTTTKTSTVTSPSGRPFSTGRPANTTARTNGTITTGRPTPTSSIKLFTGGANAQMVLGNAGFLVGVLGLVAGLL